MKALLARPLLLCSVLLMTGCMQTLNLPQASSTSTVVNSHSSSLSAELSSALSQELGYAIFVTDDAYWGQNVELSVAPVYYSAAGRVCREMVVTKQATRLSDQLISCQFGHEWRVNRNVTRVLSQQPSSFASSQ